MKKILFLTNYFYPETFKGNDVAFQLAKEGHDVTVLCNIPNYPEGRFFDGYGLFKRKKEVVNGVKVVRTFIIPRGKGRKLGMVLSYVTGLLSLCFCAIYYALRYKFDLIIVQQLSPVFIGLPAVLVKKIQKTPICYWLLDLWPDSLVAGGIKHEGIINAVGALTKYIYKHCDKILISSLGFKDILVSRGVKEEIIEHFPNWCEDDIASEEQKKLPELPEGFRIMFAGNIGRAQNFDNLMKVMLKLKERTDIKWIFVGDGRKREELQGFIRANKLDETAYLMGRYDISYMSSFFRAADIMLVSLNNEFVFNSTLPAKVQAYMISSKPILGMINGEGNYAIKDANCGFCTDADDIDGFVEMVKTLPNISKTELQAMGKNGFDYYQKYFKKSVCMNRITDIVNEF